MGCGCAEALYLDLHSPPLLIYHVRIDSYSWLSACVPRPHAFPQSLWSPLTSPLNETHVRWHLSLSPWIWMAGDQPVPRQSGRRNVATAFAAVAAVCAVASLVFVTVSVKHAGRSGCSLCCRRPACVAPRTPHPLSVSHPRCPSHTHTFLVSAACGGQSCGAGQKIPWSLATAKSAQRRLSSSTQFSTPRIT